jgi:tRNA (guanine37-N1)-methyltransferase
VPKVLLSGNQREIQKWRTEQSESRTRERRPDLYEKYSILQECKERMRKQKLLHMDMIELIGRGRAELVCEREGHILLRDRASGIYFHTAPEGSTFDAFWQELPDAVKDDIEILTIHQTAEQESVVKELGMHRIMTCYQSVCTRREKLPVSGLYRPDGQENEQGLVIKKAVQEQCEVIDRTYSLAHEEGYIRDRIAKGCMFVALVHGEFAGMVGVHEEGSLGMLEVLPQYRRQHIGKALATYVINWALEQGYTPYSQVAEGNVASLTLQEQIGNYTSREKLYWMAK